MKPKKRLKKARKQMHKAFGHLIVVEGLQDHHIEHIPRLRVPLSSLIDAAGVITDAVDSGGTGGGVVGDGEGGPGSSIPPMLPGPGDMGGGNPITSPDGGVGYMSTKGIDTADLGTIRKCTKCFNKMFKHLSEFYVHDEIRQKGFEMQQKVYGFLAGICKDLYGGETTASEPRI